MRWWISRIQNIMSIDNGSVSGMDLSTLDPSINMIHWTEGKGELDKNENGLREGFYDITPYVGYFQQFLHLVQNLELNQAKKVQVDLIRHLFESKRQLPFHYTVQAGDYYWDASDETMYGSTGGSLQNSIASINQIALAVNKMVNDINTNIANVINTSIIVVGNATIQQVNGTVVAGVNGTLVPSIGTSFANLASEIYNSLTYPGNLTINFINDSINAKLDASIARINFNIGETTYFVAAPGLGGGESMPDVPYVFGPVSNYGATGISGIAPGTMAQVAHVPATNLPPVVTENAMWVPIGETTAVPVTPTEQLAIMNGIADRTNELNIVKNQKVREVNSLTNVQDVIDYDVLADWPDIPVPPGYSLPPPMLPFTGVTIVGTPSGGGGGGVPEAPSTGITYGRKNAAWNPALALSGDVLDGGNF